MQQPAKKLNFPIAVSAALLPIVVFYAILFREVRNVPMVDDYRVFLDFILNLRQLPHLGSKLLLICSTQVFEYKLIFPEALVAVDWGLTGHINFFFLILLGYLCVPGLLYLFWKNSFTAPAGKTRRLIFLLPICYVLFSLTYADSLDFAEYSLQILTTPLFAFAAIHFCLRQGKAAAWLACVCALLSCMCSANGFLLFPIGLCLSITRRGATAIAGWCTTFTLALAAYLFRYKPAIMQASGAHTPLPQKTVFYFSLLGGIVENMSRLPIKGAAIVAGFLGVGLFFYSIRHKFYKSHPFWFHTTLWALLSAAMVTQGRSGLGIILSLSLHYKLYSVFLAIFCYTFAVSRFDTPATSQRKKHSLFASALTAAILLCAVSDYFGYRFLVNRQQRVEQGLNQFAADPAHNVPMLSLDGKPIPPQEPEYCRSVLVRAIAADIYTLPPPRKR